MTTVYGIPNCDSVKKARLWLDAHGIDYRFHDFKKQGVSAALLEEWIAACTLDRVLNRKGTTWRKLSDSQQTQAATNQGAIGLMIEQPSLIKRPVISHDNQIFTGFDEARLHEVFGQ